MKRDRERTLTVGEACPAIVGIVLVWVEVSALPINAQRRLSKDGVHLFKAGRGARTTSQVCTCHVKPARGRMSVRRMHPFILAPTTSCHSASFFLPSIATRTKYI